MAKKGGKVDVPATRGRRGESEMDRLEVAVAALAEEKLALEAQLSAARAEVRLLKRRARQLEAARAEAEREKAELSAQYIRSERANESMTSLFVATSRLHSSSSRGEVLDTIQDIITTLIGSEEIAVFELDKARRSLVLLASSGIDSARYAVVKVGRGIIGQVAASGTPYLAIEKAGAGVDELTACVPLVRDGAVTGAIAIFRLLVQKRGLSAVDRDLLDALTLHAAMALHHTSLPERSAAQDEAGA